MVKHCESVFFATLEELNATYKPNHPDVLRFIKVYGNDIKISRIMHPKDTVPRFELSCYKIIK